MTQLTQDEIDILKFMASGPDATWPPNTFYKRPAKSLFKRGLIRHDGRGYKLTEAGRQALDTESK